ncbi:BtrH N-terminal domain-containing protein [Ruminiclostridium josui]|uniref:BtrH N-terminal domain-containing protein n=1 Tax=Ruminiclostridium josui TaxID=1499 RepID=UPI0004657E33|nr:BtrH N-terminal domain-containing protein [Ruminiclostridium josui]
MLTHNIPTRIDLEFSKIVTPRELGDCRTQAFCLMLNHYGYKITTQDIFGIGNGLSFLIQKVNYNGFDLMALSGRNFEAEMKCCSTIGALCEEKTFEYNPNIEMEQIPFHMEIIEKVAEGHPVLLQCDVYYMTYLTNIKRNHNEYHMVIVLGYDLDKKELTVLDSVSNDIHKIDMHQMYKAMFEKQYDEEKKPRWYVFEKLTKKEQLVRISSDIYIKSLSEQGKYMNEKDGPLESMKTIHEFLMSIRKRAEMGSLSHEKYLAFTIEMNSIMLRRQDELNGTCFRSLYIKFLKDMFEQKIIEREKWTSLVRILNDLEDKWKIITFKIRYFKGSVIEKSDIFLSALEQIYSLEKILTMELMNI